MTEAISEYVLTSKHRRQPAPVLTGVQAQGRLDGVLFELTLRQTYRNTSQQVLEVVYTFPLPAQAVLLGFAAELNGLRQQGMVVARQAAEQRYEQALEAGDAPVLLESHGKGLYTASIGNLKPGDELVVECRQAQLVRFDQGRLRLAIPTTIAPRFGQPQQAGLQPQQVPQASLQVDYALTMGITIGAALAGASVSCPTHPVAVNPGQGGERHLQLSPGARLDRDVVLLVTPHEPQPSLLVRAHNPLDERSPVTLMAALQVPLASTPRERIAVKLLVDCSGSMAGDSMASAQAALRGVVANLTGQDLVSLSRFGSTVQHLWEPTPARPQTLRHLAPMIDGLKADMSGTEMAQALDAAFKLPPASDLAAAEHPAADVLLITDGEVWQADDMVAAARSSGHRIFAIGVGSAPAEGVLRSLAERSGGACEFATPGEALEAAAQRMLGRMRQPVHTRVRVDWGGTPAWSNEPSTSVFGGNTVIAFAGFDQPPPATGIRLLADDAQRHAIELARTEADAPCPGDSLARMAAAQRLAAMPDEARADRLALALQYQLVSDQTHCVLVHERAAGDKAVDAAQLQRVETMLAAGWGGTGRVRVSYAVNAPSPGFAESFSTSAPPPAMDWNHPSCKIRPQASRPPRQEPTMADFFKRAVGWAAMDDRPPPTLQDMAQLLGRRLASQKGLRAGFDVGAWRDHPATAAVVSALQEVQGNGLTQAQAYLLLAHWVNSRLGGLGDHRLDRQLAPLVAAIDADLAGSALRTFDRLLASYPVDSWIQRSAVRA